MGFSRVARAGRLDDLAPVLDQFEGLEPAADFIEQTGRSTIARSAVEGPGERIAGRGQRPCRRRSGICPSSLRLRPWRRAPASANQYVAARSSQGRAIVAVCLGGFQVSFVGAVIVGRKLFEGSVAACDGGLAPPERTDQAEERAEQRPTRRPPGQGRACGCRIRGCRPHGRSSRRFSPRATSDHSPRATVGIPMPCAASRLITTASAAAPSAQAGTGAAFPERCAQRAPRPASLPPGSASERRGRPGTD